MTRVQVWSSLDVRTLVHIVGPFGDWCVTHGTVPCLGFAPSRVGSPRCVNGIGLDEVEEGSLLRVEEGAEGVGSLFVPAFREPSVVLLPVHACPEGVADVSAHGSEEVGGCVDVVRDARDSPVEGTEWFDVVRAEELV